MDDALVVRRLESVGHLAGDVDDVDERHGAAGLNAVRQCLARGVLHDQQ